jgi:outer membrane protein assembly factor BamB
MSDIVYLGVKGSVVAIDKRRGKELWRTKLKGAGFTTVLVEDDLIVAHTGGELYGLDPKSGRLIWHNPLPGMGYGLAMLATKGAPNQEVMAQMIHSQESSDSTMASTPAGPA